MVSFVPIFILLACGSVTLAEETTAITTNGGPNLLHIISSTLKTESTSTSNTNSAVTSAPHYPTTDETVTSGTAHGQTESVNHPSTPVTTDYETTSSGYIPYVGNETVRPFEISGAESDNASFQNATSRDTDSLQNGSSLETSTVSFSTSPEDRTRSTSTTTVGSHGPSTTPGDTEDVHTSSAHQREGTSTGATSTTSTSTTHTTTPTTSKTTSATTTQSSVSDTTARTEPPSTSIPGTSNDESVKKGEENLSINSNHLYIFGVCIGLAGALFFITIAAYCHMSLKNSWKKKICLNGDAKRTDWLKVRRFTINDVKASLGGIPANGDIWLEMNKDSSVVL